MSKFKIFAVYLVLAAILLSGCTFVANTYTLTGSGEIVTQEMDLSGFDRVDVSHAFRVDVRRGEGFRVLIRADDNLVEHLRVERRGDTLRIGFKPGRNYNVRNATLEAEVTMPELVGLDLSGASRATISSFVSTRAFDADLSGASSLRGDIETGDAHFDVSGASRVTLSGSAADVRIDASGASRVELDDFLAADADVDASGASDVTVSASGRLDAEASGASEVHYLGDPELGRLDSSGASSIRGQ